MNAQSMNLIAGMTFLVLGVWGAYGASSPTAYIAPGIGALLLILHPGFMKEGKVVSHVVVGLTGLLTLVLIVPFIRNLGSGDLDKLIRIGVMAVVGLWACITYIKYFRAVRKAREAE